MITGQITNLDIDENEIEMTSWEIADSKDFKNIVAKSINDTVNLTSIVFENIDVSYGVEYYGRASILLKGRGWNVVNNISIISKERENNVITSTHLPTVVGNPSLNIYYNDVMATLSDVPVTDITFKLEPNECIGLGKINKYSLYLLNRDGDVIWRTIESENNVHTLSNIILENNQMFTIKGCVHCTTNEVSEMVSTTFITSSTKNGSIYIFFSNFFSNTFNVNSPLDLHLPFDYDIEEIEVDIQLISSDGTVSDVLNTTVTKDNPILSIRAYTFVRGSTYKIKTWDGKSRTFIYVKVK